LDKKKQATIHPIVIYYKENEELISTSFCIIYDSLKHDTTAVYSFIRGILPKIKLYLPNLKKVVFFSDGGPAHYKNRFNFFNLSLFECNHGVHAFLQFWATCHGKNACDVVGGTVKRLARRASLQLSLILTENVIAADTERLSNRLNPALAITVTQKYHFYGPISKGVLRASRTSVQDRAIFSKRNVCLVYRIETLSPYVMCFQTITLLLCS
jgi:hypothetical protein